jgi:ferric-dicitrate binding protein FerR (iron transport regulator)
MSQNHNDHADQNVERLIGRSYRPDAPDPDFVARVENRLLAAAREKRDAPAAPPRLRLLPRIPAALAAAAMIAAVGGLAYMVDGSLPEAGRSELVTAVAPDGSLRPRQGVFGLVPRDLAPPPETARVEDGDVLRTGTAERRRVTLPDGSILFVDAESEVAVEDERLLRVESGSVYVEVEPDPERPFRVLTPTRELTALGTRFAVDVEDGATRLLVTHGVVQAAGVDRVVRTGERLVERDGTAFVESGGRTSHEIAWTRDLIAAAASPLVPSSDFEGGALIAMDPWGQETRLSLRKYHVDVHIEDGFARTTIDQTYFNHAHWRLEGTFYFPLPADASLSRLAMYVAGRRMEGGMSERNRARDVYEQIVHRRKDPALLEWVDGSTFKMRVFPLEPREEKRILMSYVQRLPSLYGQATYRFPAARDLGIVNDWSFHAKVVGIDDFRCDTHEMVGISSELGVVDLHTEKKGVLMDDDVVLHLSDLNAPPSGDTSFRSVEHEGFRYLMVRHRPELEARRAPERRDWIFLVETAANRDPVLARAQVELVREMLALAEKDDRFTVVTAATRATTLSDDLLTVSPENVDAALDMLENAHLIGALDMRRALSATRPLAAAGERAVIVHVGSGVSTLGERDPARLARLVPEGAAYVGVAVGRQWSRPFMKQAAARTGGLYTQVDPTDTLKWRAFDLRATLDTLRVLDATVVDDAEKAAFLGFEDSAAHGEEIVAVTRVPAGNEMPSRITLAGRIDGRAWSQTIAVADVEDGAGYLPRQWARLEIERLLADDAEAHRKEIVALSKAMYVMSPYTSLLVLETDEMYERFGVDRGRSDHWALYPAPDEIPVVKEPHEKPVRDLPEGVRNVDDVLGTILVRVPPYLVQSQGGPWSWRYGYAGGTYNIRDLRQWARSYGPAYYGATYMFDYDVELAEASQVHDELRGDEETLRAVEHLREAQAQDRWGFFGGFDARRQLAQPWNGPIGIGGGSGGRFALGMNAREVLSDSESRWGLLDSYGWAGSGDGSAPVSGLRVVSELSGLFGTRDEPVEAGRSSLELQRVDGLFGNQLTTATWEAGGDVGEQIRHMSPQGMPVDLARASRPRPVVLPGLHLGGAYRGPAGEVPPDSREPSDPPPPPDDRLAMSLLARMQQGTLYQVLQYQRPWVNNDARYFADLLHFAPGMNTTAADVASVLETEGARPVTRGAVDEGAARLIAAARSAGWMRVHVAEDVGGYDVTFDGAGRFRLERTLPVGLREIIVCDGKTVRHLYPQIGVGAVRKASRQLRGMLSGIAPWLLGPVEDLSVGADVRRIDERTVEVVPLHDDTYRLQLELAGGRLAERRLVKGDEVLVRQSFEYGKDGVSVSTNTNTSTEASVAAYGIGAVAAQAPDLVAPMPGLVELPLPYRTRQHVWQARKLQEKGDREAWSEEDALALLASDFGTNWNEARATIHQRFLPRGDTRLGFHVLMLAGGYRWDVATTVRQGRHPPVSQDPRTFHPDSALAHYVAACANRDTNQNLVLPERFGDGFLGQLATTATEISRWTTGRGNNVSDHDASRNQALDVIASVKSIELRWALLTTYWSYVGLDSARAGRMADLLEPLTDLPRYAYHARYDRATALGMVGTDVARAESLREFAALHATALEHGVLPMVDGNFMSSLRGSDDEKWRSHWREAAKALIERGSRHAVPYVGMQLYWMGDHVLADELLELALDECPDRSRIATTMSVVEVLWHQGHHARAESLVEALLEQERFQDSASLWRLGAYLADAQGAVARGVLRQERALDLAFDDLPEIVNLSIVRQEYGNLLARFQQLATAVEALGGDVPDTVITRVVRAADRWRALDDDPTAACHQAARILRTLGAEELAWDYLTTPLGMRPNEGAPWHQLAQQLQAEGDIDNAARCYATAFAIEPTNAQYLWDRAEMLRSAGRSAEAQEDWRTLANGEWQPRFQWVRDQARQRLGR